jgi:NTE family protein
MGIKSVVFSGAGFKCWAYIGVIRTLQEYKLDIEHVIGTSAGGIFGLFYVLGISWEFLLDYLMEIDFKQILDIDIDNILVQQSIFAGIEFTRVIKELLTFKIDPDITFKELYRYSKIKFTTNALNITDCKHEYFNYELTPDTKVIDAVRASCCLPLMLPPYKINEKYYYDGGLCNNLPIDLLDEVNSIGFTLDSYPDTNNSDLKLTDLLVCMTILMNKSNKHELYNIYNVVDESFKDDLLNTDQSRDDIFNKYMYGYLNSKDILLKNHFSLPAN